jgi:methionine-gamma-lyase
MDNNALDNAGFMTQAIHAGQEPDPAFGALATPIYQTSTFCFENVEEGMDIFDGKKPGYAYSRGGNPTVETLQRKMAALEGGEACVAAGSGMGAISSVVLSLLAAGDHIIVGDCVYGCTNVVIRDVLPKFGVEVTPVDTADIEAVKAALQPNTKMVYFETPTNPMMKVTDIAAVKAAVGEDVRVVVDNTFAPPPIQRPLACGADIVLHSVTKYLNGHGDVIAGVVIGSAEDIAIIKGIGVTKLTGAICSPHDAFLIIRGLQTLGMRVERHCANAQAIAEYLESEPHVKSVRYPGLASSPYHDLVQSQMNGMGTGILSFELANDVNGLSSFEAGKKLLNALKISHIAVSLGDPASLIQHPASMTHHNVAPEVREQMGIGDGLIRFSAGLEDVDDLIADFKQAFATL